MTWIKEGIDVLDRLKAASKRILERERESRPFLVEPMRTSDPDYHEHLVAMIRSRAGVPLARCKGANKVANFVRIARTAVVLQNVTPKSGFRIAGWKHTATARLDSGVVHTTTGSSILLVHLGEEENVEHLIRSAQVGITKDLRLVVLATPEDLCDPDADVRCIYVNALAAQVVEKRGFGVILASSTSIADGQPVTIVKAQRDVPPSALWLICDSDDQTPPVDDWGNLGEEFMETQRPLGENSERDQVLKRQAKELGALRFTVLAISGLGPPAGLFPWSISEGLDSFDTIMLWISIAWLGMAAVIGIFMASAFFRSQRLSRRWRQQAGKHGAHWNGGSFRGVLLRRMLKGVFLKKGMKAVDLWESAWPSSPLLQSQDPRAAKTPTALQARHPGRGGSCDEGETSGA